MSKFSKIGRDIFNTHILKTAITFLDNISETRTDIKEIKSVLKSHINMLSGMGSFVMMLKKRLNNGIMHIRNRKVHITVPCIHFFLQERFNL